MAYRVFVFFGLGAGGWGGGVKGFRVRVGGLSFLDRVGT